MEEVRKKAAASGRAACRYSQPIPQQAVRHRVKYRLPLLSYDGHVSFEKATAKTNKCISYIFSPTDTTAAFRATFYPLHRDDMGCYDWPAS